MGVNELLLIAAAVLFYRIGQHEYGAGFVTAGLSIIVTLVITLVLGLGHIAFFFGQVALFGGLTWYNGERVKRLHGRK